MRLTQKVLATKIKPLYGNENTDGESYPLKTLKELLQWGMNGGSMRYGYVQLHGWTYDLGEFMEPYLVRIDGNEYREIYACNEQMARDLASVPANAEVFIKPNKEDKTKIAKAVKSFEALIDLATCDDTLYSDGINIELEDQARFGLQQLKSLKGGK